MRGGAFYDSNAGIAAARDCLVRAKMHMRDEVWNAEWNGFFGVFDQKCGPDPETVQCSGA